MSTKIPLSLVCVGHLLLGMGLPLGVVCIPSENPLEKTEFSFGEWLLLETASGSGMGTTSFPLSA